LVCGDHVRAQDAQAQIQMLATTLNQRLADLLDAEEDEEPKKAASNAKKRKSKGNDADES
jgi:hypothetical protein